MSENQQQNLENNPAPKSPESELSPEVLESVMEKVQDINEKGTAYTVIGAYGGAPNLQKILKEGLLGSDYGIPNKTEWAKKVRKSRSVSVYFNIIGQGANHIEDSHWVLGSDEKTIILFDLSAYDETKREERKPNQKRQNRTYEADLDNAAHRVSTEYGYKLFSRVAPRYFRGLVIKPYDRTNESERQRFIEEKSKEYLAQVQQIDKEKPELLLPIYDIHGNLQWPQKMNYEEVKKFVDERDKNKKEQKNEK